MFQQKVLLRKHYSLEQLVTLLAEIEAVLNSRPQTYVYEDLDSGFTLTPNQFLANNKKLGLCNSDNADYHCDEDHQPSWDSATKFIETWTETT